MLVRWGSKQLLLLPWFLKFCIIFITLYWFISFLRVSILIARQLPLLKLYVYCSKQIYLFFWLTFQVLWMLLIFLYKASDRYHSTLSETTILSIPREFWWKPTLAPWVVQIPLSSSLFQINDHLNLYGFLKFVWFLLLLSLMLFTIIDVLILSMPYNELYFCSH